MGAHSRVCAAQAGRVASATEAAYGRVPGSGSSRPHTVRRLGRAGKNSPTMSRTCSMNSGSLESLNVSLRCGWSANAFHIRLTALWLIPERAAIERGLQCVASEGALSNVSVITRSTSASEIDRGAPSRARPATHRAVDPRSAGATCQRSPG